MPGFVLVLCTAVLDLVAAALGWGEVRVVTKPLPALILAAVAWRAGTPGSRWLSAGLVLAAAGDELLLRAGDSFFLAGMLAFAAMHASYIAAFLRRRGRPLALQRLALTGIPYAVALLVVVVQLLPHTGSFTIPLVVYGLLLVSMASASAQVTRIAAVGGLAFVVSDLTLALAKFGGLKLGVIATELAVVGTYFLAQLLIVWGTTDAAIQNAEHDQTLGATEA